MNSEEIEKHYQHEALMAHTIGLSVPVSIEIQQLIELRKISETLDCVVVALNQMLALLEKPPLVTLPSTLPTATAKKDSPK